ncbi:MAG: hypothetical protein ACRDUS_06435 [Mycobacterium sp.]
MSVRLWIALLAAPLLVAGCSYFGSRQHEDWRARTAVDSAELEVDAALRDIDPCGFVDAESIKTKIPRAISYGYTEGFDRCTLQLGAFDGDFPSDVSATIGLDLTPGPKEMVEQPTDSMKVNGIAVTHMLGPTSNRGWCRYVFNLGMDDLHGASSRGAADLMKRVRVEVLATLAKDPGAGVPVYPCKEAIAIATGAAQIRSQHLPLWSDSVPRPAGQDPCSVLADVRGFASYRPSGVSGLATDLYSCWLSSGPPGDRKASGVQVTLRPVDPREPDASSYGDERHSVVEQRGGVELHVSTVTREYEKPFCEVYVFLGKSFVPNVFHPGAVVVDESRVPGIVVEHGSCEDVKTVAVAAAKRFGQ